MKTSKGIFSQSLLLAAVSLGINSMATAQTFDVGYAPAREGSWDFYVPLIYSPNTTVNGEGGSKAEINDDLGFGLGAGYNFNNHFQLGGSFNWSSRNYDATTVRDDGTDGHYGNSLETSTIAMNGVYYILSGNVTPFVSGSVGYSYIDTNIQNGPTQTVAYYDPWYGYVYDTYTPTKTDSDFSYSAGIGLRADINDVFALQFSYNKTWLSLDYSSDSFDVDSYRIDFVFRMF